MVAINNTNSVQSALSLDIASGLNHVFAAIDSLTSRLKAAQAYRQTVSQLNALSDRELSDIGISRGEIKAIASKSI